jgi:general secretion pathway protein F
VCSAAKKKRVIGSRPKSLRHPTDTHTSEEQDALRNEQYQKPSAPLLIRQTGMATFEYTARAEPGRTLEGRIEAESVRSAAQHLRAQGLFPMRVEMQARGTRRLGGLAGRWRRGKVGLAPLAEFTDQLADLLEAGIPLERALRLQAQHVSQGSLKAGLDSLGEAVRAGRPLAEAMSAWPKVFPRTYASMVKVGEEAGLMAEMLRRLAKSLEEEHQLRSKLRAAMVYPLFLVCIGLGTVLVLMVWVIPKFGSFFESLEQQLPLPTRIVIGLSSVLGRAAPLLAAGGLLAVLLILRLLKLEAVKLRCDRVSLRLPLVGGLLLRFQLARLMRTLGLLLSHGVNMLGALEITAETLSNKHIARELLRAAQQATHGRKLHECFSGGGVFPASVIGLIAMGQESGNLPQMLLRMSQQYEQQTERHIRTLTGMMEPVMILIMGGIIGFVVVSMLMPVFRASALVK